MNSALILQDVVYVVALLAIGYPLGCYIYKIYNEERVAASGTGMAAAESGAAGKH